MILPRDAATSIWGRLLFLALVNSNAAGLECNFLPNANAITSYIPPSVSNQEDIDRVFAGCTSIIGDIIIANNYTGSFVLSNVTSISSGIATQNGDFDSLPAQVPSLTSIEVRNLTSIATITIINATALTSVSFPDLSTLGGIEVQAASGLALGFPSLQNVSEYISIHGDVRMEFPLLTTVNYTIEVTSNPLYGPLWGPRSPDITVVDSTSYPPLDISFPALENAAGLVLSGNISSIFLPRFSRTTVNLDDGAISPNGVLISTYGAPLDVGLPSLSNTSSLRLLGTIGTISIPSLFSLTTFSIVSSDPLEVSFAPLEKIHKINLSGKITGLSMSTVDSVNSGTIDSSIAMDCSPASAAWDRSSHAETDSLSCYSPASYSGYVPLSKRLGLGIGFSALAVVLFTGYLVRRRFKKAQKSKTALPPPGYELGLPPKYSTAADLTSEQTLGGVSARSVDESSIDRT